jgi:deoxyribose-phosphate aldolase
MNTKNIAGQILPLIDLTSLNNDDNEATITKLCQQAITNHGNVAAVCIFSQFLPLAIHKLDNSNVKVATVINFPHGRADLDFIFLEAELAMDRGADEIDLVFPYHELMHGNQAVVETIIAEVRDICDDAKLKVILETGELKSPQLINQACQISLDNGADFLKTSTGKVAVNATIDAAKIMLEAIKNHGGNCGFKAAGGIKTIAEAFAYIQLAELIMGSSYINPQTFRFGASSLLNNVLSALNGNESDNSNNSNQSGY